MGTPARTAVICAALAAAMAGCSDGGGENGEPDDREQSIIDQLAETEPAAEQEDPAAVEAARSRFLVECMDEEGFDYEPVGEESSVQASLGLTQAEFLAQYGFGHSTIIDLSRAAQARAQAADAERMAAFDAMSDAERGQYAAAEQVCLEESYAEFGFPLSGYISLPTDSVVQDYIDRAVAAAADDPRVAEVTEAWSACMGDQGYDFADRDDMGLPLEEEAQPFAAAYEAQGQALVDAGRSWEELRVADVLDAQQLAALQELQQRELAIAAAHLHCLEQGHDIDAVHAEVYQEHLAEIAGS